MRAECIKAVSDYATSVGVKLKAADFRGIEDKIYQARKHLAKQDRAAWNALSVDEQLKQAGKLVADQAMHEAILKRQRADLQVIKEAELRGQLERLEGSMDANESLRRLSFSIYDGKTKQVLSMEGMVKGITEYALGKLDDFRELRKQSSFAGFMTNEKNLLDFENEAYGIHTGNALAKKAWKNVEKVQNELLDRARRAGFDIPKMANYRFGQALDGYKIHTRGGKDGKAFVEDYMAYVDREEYVNPDGTMMNDDQMRKFLHEAWVTQRTDGANKPKGEGVGMAANRMKAHRQIHYKSPEAYHAAMDKYGAGNAFDQVINHIEALSKDIALVEKFGPNAIDTWNRLHQEAAQKTGTVDKAGEVAFKNLSGQYSTANPVVAHVAGEMKSAMVASRLGSMIGAQFSDLGTFDAAARAMNIPLSEAGFWLKNIATDKNLRETLRLHGYGVESVLTSVTRIADGATTHGIFGKLATAVPTIQGAHLWTQTLRQAFGAMMEAKLGDMVSRYDSMAALSPDDRARFESIGINEADWKIWRLAKPLEYKGNKLLNADAIEKISIADLQRAIPERFQHILNQGAELQQRMEGQNLKEQGWLQGRQQKFAEYKQKIQQMIDDYTATREKRFDDAVSRNAANGMIDILKIQTEKAELAASLADFWNRETDFAKIKEANVEFGRKSAELDRALKDAQKRLADIKKTADKEVFAKAAEFEKRVDKRMTELDEFTKSVTERMEKRDAIVQEWNDKIGQKIEQELFAAKQESATKLVAVNMEQSHQAVLQPSALSQTMLTGAPERGTVQGEIKSLVLQFKSFPFAFFRQALMERANFEAAGYNPWVFRARMMAVTTVLGGLSLWFQDLVTGKTPRDVDAKFAREAFLKGGGLGIYNEIIEAGLGSVESPWQSGTKMLGPFPGYVVGTALPTAAHGAAYLASGFEDESEKKKFTKGLYDSAIGIAPGQNLWFLRGFLHNVMLDDLQNMANPGYNERQRERLAKRGQEFWLGRD